MDEGIDELNTEFQEEEDKQLAQWRFRELMDALDVEEVTQEMALAILREEGMPAVQVRSYGMGTDPAVIAFCRCSVDALNLLGTRFPFLY